MIVFERGGMLWAFNLHPTSSYTGYRIGTPWSTTHRIVLQSDRTAFGGHDRLDEHIPFHPTPLEWNGRACFVEVYLPCRTAIVLLPDPAAS